jgi:hypothetical protein
METTSMFYTAATLAGFPMTDDSSGVFDSLLQGVLDAKERRERYIAQQVKDAQFMLDQAVVVLKRLGHHSLMVGIFDSYRVSVFAENCRLWYSGVSLPLEYWVRQALERGNPAPATQIKAAVTAWLEGCAQDLNKRFSD